MLVNNKAEYGRHIGVYLNPGVNDLSEKNAKKFMKVYENPTLQHLFNDDIELVKESKDEDVSPFVNLNADEAIKLLKETTNVELLEQFKKDELESKNRKTVLEAIDNRIEVLVVPADETFEEE